MRVVIQKIILMMLVMPSLAYADVNMAGAVRQKGYGVFTDLMDSAKNAAESAWQSVENAGVSAWHSVEHAGESVGTFFRNMFVDPAGFYYNYAIFNDSNQDITAGVVHQDMVMGGQFASAAGITYQAYAQSLYQHQPSPLLATDPYLQQTFSTVYQSGATTGAWPFVATAGVSSIYANSINVSFNLFISTTMSDPRTNPLVNDMMIDTSAAGKANGRRIYVYHIFTKKVLQQGNYVHMPSAEQIGYDSVLPADKSNVGVVLIPQSAAYANKNSLMNLSSTLSSLVLYNNTASFFVMSLLYAGKPYEVLLEPYSFANLGAPPTAQDATASTAQAAVPSFSLRPNVINFYISDVTAKHSTTPDVVFPLSAQGFDNASYVLEVYQDAGKGYEAGLQGFLPGNFDQPTNNARDITPTPCTFWYESAAQYTTSAQNELTTLEKSASAASDSLKEAQQAVQAAPYMYDAPGQVWVASSTNSFAPFKVTPGTAANWSLVRPLVIQKQMFIYFLYVQTQDDTVAQTFIQNFLTGAIGTTEKKMLLSPLGSTASMQVNVSAGGHVTGQAADAKVELTIEEKIESALATLPQDLGHMVDSSKTVGWLLGSDIFLPSGTGVNNFYYQLEPVTIQMATVAQIIALYLDAATFTLPAGADASTFDVSTLYVDQVVSWVTGYLANSAQVEQEITQFICAHGKASMLDVPATAVGQNGQITNRSAVSKLSAAGAAALQRIVHGPVSIANPPVQYSVVQNLFVYGQQSAPKDMPQAITVG